MQSSIQEEPVTPKTSFQNISKIAHIQEKPLQQGIAFHQIFPKRNQAKTTYAQNR